MRPALPPRQKRTRRKELTFSPTEWAVIEQRARECGVRPNCYIRDVVLGAEVFTDVETGTMPDSTSLPEPWRNQPYTFKRTLVIPGDLTSGNDYWVGAVIDYDNALGETVSSNNATYIPIRIN